MSRQAILTAICFMGCIAAYSQNLESVLNAMDKAAADFHTAQCGFVWDQYTRVVDYHEYQKGAVYFRRQGDDVEMSSDLTFPERKYVLYKQGEVDVYLPSASQVTQYYAKKNKADYDTFLLLGFGGRGHDLEKSFDVKFGGLEQMQGVNAGKLVLTPKSRKVAEMFSVIVLWIDLARGISVAQRFEERSGDYRVATYVNIRINEKIPNEVFQLHTTGKVTYVKPNS